ncbi:pickpocket protein 28-like [Anastrepha obliqua]|uniref:pickpocket protein 28-like n=1 Tax=Anastrepha obliqua TaxID=95512 RepID=UPI00240907B9|nr:pickpocket protein 28-like [Anastrepha obliqua]
MSAFFVNNIYDKWNHTPLIVSINPNPTSITQDPFPAVTICNLNQAYKQIAEKFSVYSPEYAMLQLICEREANATIASSITDWSNLRNFITKIAQPCSEMLLTCRFGGVNYKCSEIFSPIVTDEGLCCAFNLVDAKFVHKNESVGQHYNAPNGTIFVDWTPEHGYPSELPQSYIPMPAAGTGESLGLSITLDVERNFYYCSSSNSVGFKVLLHNPLEFPNMREFGLLLSPGHETQLRVQTFKTESERHLRAIKKNSRACLFQDELSLLIYRTNESICSIYESKCVKRILLQYSLSNNGKGCSDICWPNCFDLSFQPDFFSTPLSHSGFQISNQVIKKINSSYAEQNIAVLNVYFKEIWYRSSKKAEYVGITEFMSNLGGIIGLFFGFSFISLAEFIFYLLLKPIRMLIVVLWAQRRRKSAKIQKLHNSKSFKRQSSHSLSLSDRKHILRGDYENKRNKADRVIIKVPTKRFYQNTNTLWKPGMDYTP